MIISIDRIINRPPLHTVIGPVETGSVPNKKEQSRIIERPINHPCLTYSFRPRGNRECSKQSRTEQSRTEHNITEQNREQNRTEYRTKNRNMSQK
jgi:hypothetical protein